MKYMSRVFALLIVFYALGIADLHASNVSGHDWAMERNIQITESSVLFFTPDVSGFWSITASNEFGGSAEIFVYDDGIPVFRRFATFTPGLFIGQLQAGREYQIHVQMPGHDTGEVSLAINPVPIVPMNQGDSMEISKANQDCAGFCRVLGS